MLTPGEFKFVFQDPRCVLKTNTFTVYQKKNTLSVARLGIAFSKRFVARATDRNYLRRQVREYFRKQKQVFADTDLVFVVKRKLSDRLVMKQAITELWAKLSSTP